MSDNNEQPKLIVRPGKYRRRNGEIVEVKRRAKCFQSFPFTCDDRCLEVGISTAGVSDMDTFTEFGNVGIGTLHNHDLAERIEDTLRVWTLEVGKHYVTRDRSQFRKVTTQNLDMKYAPFTVASIPCDFVYYYRDDGSIAYSSGESAVDLMFPALEDFDETYNWNNLVDATKLVEPEKKEYTFDGWMNMYEDGLHVPHRDKTLADRSRLDNCIACVKVTITYREGDGLDNDDGN